MTLYEFNRLEQPQQYETVLNGLGVYLDNYINGKQRYNLYAIDKFFVEVEYDAEKNEIKGLRAFKAGELLDKYSNLENLF
jgi:hypothetical protein